MSTSSPRFLGIIPARYASTRFPGKPLADMHGKPMIRRVYEAVATGFDHTVVATDDKRIHDAVRAFGGNVVMTDANHQSGTDRCREAMEYIDGNFDVIINVQGDEPFIAQQQIELLKGCFGDPSTEIATLVFPFSAEATFEQLENPNSPKVVVSPRGDALYFSRSVVPYLRGIAKEEWLLRHTFYKHIGLYGYRRTVLEAITQLPPSPLECAESLEQLRWLEQGYRIRTAITPTESIGIDTPEDLVHALATWAE